MGAAVTIAGGAAYLTHDQAAGQDVEMPRQARNDAREVIQDWDAKPRDTAMKLIQKYGQPSEVTDMRLVWHDKDPWKIIEVENDMTPHNFPVPHVDYLTQTINYEVSPDMFAELGFYDGSVYVRRTEGELAARCDKEEANILALNLSHDVLTRAKSVEEAREFYTQAITSPSAEHHRYMKELIFSVPTSKQADPDVSTGPQKEGAPAAPPKTPR